MAEFKQGLCNCFGDCGVCCCGYWCFPCQTYQTAESLGKSGILYSLLSCLFPCVPMLLLRQEARERYNIEGDTMGDVVASVCCTACVGCQVSKEVQERGDQ